MRICSRLYRGFSLIELMVALVITGILAAIAYPAYTSHLQRSRRADAVAGLGIIMQTQERYRSNNSTYASSLSQLQISNLTAVTQHYDLSFAPVGTPAGYEIGYAVTATPLATGKQVSDITCKSLKVELKGALATYSAMGDPSNSGTDRDTSAECWPK